MRRPSRSSPELVPPPESVDASPHEREAPESREKTSGMHLRPFVMPAHWLDRLFVAACEMPVDEGERAVVESLVEAVSELLPSRAVGVVLCVRSRTPELVLGLPPGFPAPHEARTGERLFPSLPEVRARGAASELKALTSHMVQAEKLASIGQLAAGIVHELNNPLTSIVVYTDALLRQAGDGGDPEAVERLRRIGESAGRMLRFTRDLISYARPSREVQVAVSVAGVVQQALTFCEHVLAEAKAEVVCDFGGGEDGEGGMVRGMPEQLAQVFVNLVTNACHAMAATARPGVLRVATRSTSESVLVVVEDNGTGVAEEDLARVFTPFFTTKAPGEGTGLGLSIVKKIVDDHRAVIAVERRHEGGTRFVLTFPRLGASG